MAEVLDLDVLRPKPVLIKLGGNEIDVSFIPCGITFEIDKISRELVRLAPKVGDGTKSNEATRQAFDLSLKMCSIFCEPHYPEMDEEWFRANTSPDQIYKFADLLQDTLTASFSAVEGYQKN